MHREKSKRLDEFEIFKIDLDNRIIDRWYDDWLRTRILILKYFNYKVVKVVKKLSPSSRGYHIWLHCKPKKRLMELDRVKINGLLGDDPTRNWLAYNRVLRGVAYWDKLFSKVIYKRPEKEGFKYMTKKQIISSYQRLLKAVRELNV